MHRDTQHIVGDVRPYARTVEPLKQEKSELLLIQDLYSARKLRQHARFHEPGGQRLQRFRRFSERLIAVGASFAKHGLSAADKSAKHDDMLRKLSVPATGAGRGGNAWDTAFMKKIGQAHFPGPCLGRESTLRLFSNECIFSRFLSKGAACAIDGPVTRF